MEVANAALPTYVVTLLFFAGFLLRWKNIPNYWKWCAPPFRRVEVVILLPSPRIGDIQWGSKVETCNDYFIANSVEFKYCARFLIIDCKTF